jgi:multiple sugar transport system ATP-binding protein
MQTSHSPFLHIDHVYKTFGDLEVLHDINIELEEGGFLVLVGPSGCGKSTLLNMIAGFETATQGDIRLGDRSLTGLHPSQRDIAMVFQSYALYPNMNVADNIGFGMETRGVKKDERVKKIDEVAEMLQIQPLLKRKPSQLSGGQRQRVAMGRALVRDPRLFLFDEPLSNLDARLRVDMRIEIKNLHDSLGTSIVYVTHDQIEAMTLATKIAVLNQGQVLQVGTPEEIYNTPANEFVADFMGSPSMNKAPVKLDADGSSVTIQLADQHLTLHNPTDALHQLATRQEKAVLGIRAEDISTTNGHDGLTDNELPLTVQFVEPTGSDNFISAGNKTLTFVSRAKNDVRPVVGSSVRMKLDMNRLHFFSTSDGKRIA